MFRGEDSPKRPWAWIPAV